jgi:hypothetical protein
LAVCRKDKFYFIWKISRGRLFKAGIVLKWAIDKRRIVRIVRILILTNIIIYTRSAWIWGILQSDWFSTSRILADILLVEKNKMAAQTEFPTFCERENDKLFAYFIAFTGLKTQWKVTGSFVPLPFRPRSFRSLAVSSPSDLVPTLDTVLSITYFLNTIYLTFWDCVSVPVDCMPG